MSVTSVCRYGLTIRTDIHVCMLTFKCMCIIYTVVYNITFWTRFNIVQHNIELSQIMLNVGTKSDLFYKRQPSSGCMDERVYFADNYLCYNLSWIGCYFQLGIWRWRSLKGLATPRLTFGLKLGLSHKTTNAHWNQVCPAAKHTNRVWLIHGKMYPRYSASQ